MRWVLLIIAGTWGLACSPGSISVTDAGDDPPDAGQDAGADSGADPAGDLGSDAGADPGADPGGDPGGDLGADDGGSTPFSCDQPDPAWLLCEDFETGAGDFDAWFAASDFLGGAGTDNRGQVTLSSQYKRSGDWAAHMPADASADFKGGSLDWRACDGEQRTNCDMRSFDQLYFRSWVRFASDHRLVHHFLNIGGSQPDDYWYHGLAGCLPNGSLSMGTTVESRPDSHETYFYSYSPDMSCNTNCGSDAEAAARCAECLDKGLPTCEQQIQCCWGNIYQPDPPVSMPLDRWFCFEMMMQANTPGEHDGQMAYWLDGLEIHREQGMFWRISPTLALNRVRLQHYITAEDSEGHSNKVWFDDVVVSTQPVGCD